MVAEVIEADFGAYVYMPESVDDAVGQLAEIGGLITASEWHRAAIVAALVGPSRGAGARSDLAKSGQVMTTRELAARRIAGLKSRATIEKYRDRWFAHRDETPALGQAIDLTGLPDWSEAKTEERSREKAAKPEPVHDPAAEQEIVSLFYGLVEQTFTPKNMATLLPETRNRLAQLLRRALNTLEERA